MPFGAPADPFSTRRFACLLAWLFACLASRNHTELGTKSSEDVSSLSVVPLASFRRSTSERRDRCPCARFPLATSPSSTSACHRAEDVDLLPGTVNMYYKTAWAKLFLQGWSGKAIVSEQPGRPHEHAECHEHHECQSDAGATAPSRPT